MKENHSDTWRRFYEESLSRPHHSRTEFAVTLNRSSSRLATDCGCGTGSDIQYLSASGYQVHGFDGNTDSVAICRDRFGADDSVFLTRATFEEFVYPKVGIVIANSSLFFADPTRFQATWQRIASSIEKGGVFAGDFMGPKDDWASNYRSSTTPLTEKQVRALFSDFNIVRFHERDEKGTTAIGNQKHWHTYSLVAVKVC